MAEHAEPWGYKNIREDLAGFATEEPKHRIYTEAELEDFEDVKDLIAETRERSKMIEEAQVTGPVSARAHINAQDRYAKEVEE